MAINQLLNIDWTHIDTVMFDMDGTLLDLAFDNFFWREAVIDAWADAQQVTRQFAIEQLTPLFRAQEGCLNWYSLPYWSETLKLDLQALKVHHSDLISLRAGVPALLKTLQVHGKKLWLVTNAHPQALEIKLNHTGLGDFFTTIITSHEYGFAKEQINFWYEMQETNPFTPSRSLMIDDSEPVLHTAQEFGLHVLGIEQPDSQLPARENLFHPTINNWAELVQGLE